MPSSAWQLGEREKWLFPVREEGSNLGGKGWGAASRRLVTGMGRSVRRWRRPLRSVGGLAIQGKCHFRPPARLARQRTWVGRGLGSGQSVKGPTGGCANEA